MPPHWLTPSLAPRLLMMLCAGGVRPSSRSLLRSCRSLNAPSGAMCSTCQTLPPCHPQRPTTGCPQPIPDTWSRFPTCDRQTGNAKCSTASFRSTCGAERSISPYLGPPVLRRAHRIWRSAHCSASGLGHRPHRHPARGPARGPVPPPGPPLRQGPREEGRGRRRAHPAEHCLGRDAPRQRLRRRLSFGTVVRSCRAVLWQASRSRCLARRARAARLWCSGGCAGRCCAGSASYGDDDLSPGAALLEVADGFRDLGQRVCPVDHRRDFP